MRPLLELCACAPLVLADSLVLPRCDAVVALGDLPLLLGFDGQDAIPAPYALEPHAETLTEIALLLEELIDGPILAITWRAGFAADAAMRKQLSLAEIAAVARLWDGPVVAVQRAPDVGELAQLERSSGKKIHDFCALNDDLVQMAALLHVVDEYIGVSNTNMHVMASLGNASRVLVKQPGEWRWLAAGPSTPWMPRARLYREDRLAGWTPALRMLGADLAAARENSLGRRADRR
jgi:hypothetical protein